MQQNCEAFEQNGTIARYVAGKAASDEARAFEEHYLTCETCFNGLTLGAGVRLALREPVSVVVPLKRRNRGKSYGLIAGVGIAAALSGILIGRNMSLARVEALGLIGEVPAYGGVAVRATDESNAEAEFAAGMDAYVAGRYQDASTRLSRALEAGMEPIPAAFFLGASQLELDDAASAATSFNRVIAAGESPYSTEAHYYLAKALLRQRRADEALEHLQQAAQTTDPIASRAGALADSVQKVNSRFF